MQSPNNIHRETRTRILTKAYESLMTVFYKITGALRLAVCHCHFSGGIILFSTCFHVARGNGNERRRMFTSGRALRFVTIVVAAAVHAFNPRDNDGAGMLSLNS